MEGVSLRDRIEVVEGELPAKIDALSARLMKRLMPAEAEERWPQLNVDSANARLYTDFFRALEARQWPQAEQRGIQTPWPGTAQMVAETSALLATDDSKDV